VHVPVVSMCVHWWKYTSRRGYAVTKANQLTVAAAVTVVGWHMMTAANDCCCRR
jgi:hypothetical protein